VAKCSISLVISREVIPSKIFGSLSKLMEVLIFNEFYQASKFPKPGRLRKLRIAKVSQAWKALGNLEPPRFLKLSGLRKLSVCQVRIASPEQAIIHI